MGFIHDGLNSFLSGFSLQSFSVGVDSSYQAILDKATADGVSLPSTLNQVAQNKLIKSLKACGAWGIMDIGYIFAGSNNAFATYNIKNPLVHRATLVNSPSYSSLLGFTGDGISRHLSTNWNAAANGVNYTLNDAGVAVYVTTAAINADSVLTGLLTTRNRLSNRAVDPQRINSDTASTTFSNSGGIGYHGFSRTSSTSVQSFDGTVVTQPLNSSAVVNDTSFILRAGSSYGNLAVGFVAFGASTAAIDSSIKSALDVYMGAIS
jgi:hypothetical protein